MVKTKRKRRSIKHPPYLKFMGFLTENRLGLKDIAQVIGSTVPTVSAKNNGYADYTMSEVDAICNTFGCTSDIFRTTKG